MAKPYKTVTLRLNASQYAHLHRQAEASGLKMEPLLRQLIMGVNLRPRPPDTYAALRRELNALGTNIIQSWRQLSTVIWRAPIRICRRPCAAGGSPAAFWVIT